MTIALKPVFELGLFRTQRSGHEDKLGGLPFGLPASKWPSCKVCGLPQVYLAQFRASNQLRLGRDGRVLFLFQCPDGPCCGSWDPSTGASCALLVDEDQLTNHSTDAPVGTPVEPEAIIVGWEPAERGFGTYVGGTPKYTASHDENRGRQGRFLMQLFGAVDFKGPVPTPDQTGAEHRHYWGGRYGLDNVKVEQPPNPRQHFGDWSRGQMDVPGRPSQIMIYENGEWGFEWATFGGGVAYVFMDDEKDCAFYFWEI
jgi:hypothetical protein